MKLKVNSAKLDDIRKDFKRMKYLYKNDREQFENEYLGPTFFTVTWGAIILWYFGKFLIWILH
jgi:hypothetical protein